MAEQTQPEGRPRATTDQQIVDVIETADDPVLTTSEIAQDLPIGERGLRDRLKNLAEQNEIVTKKVGRSRIWYSVDVLKYREGKQRFQEKLEEAQDAAKRRKLIREGKQRIQEELEEPQEETTEFQPASELTDQATDAGAHTSESEPSQEYADIYDRVVDLDLPGAGRVLSDRRKLIRAVLEYIEEHGAAGRQELIAELVDDNPAGYQDGYSAWKNLVQPSLGTLSAESSQLVSPGEGGHTWRWAS